MPVLWLVLVALMIVRKIQLSALRFTGLTEKLSGRNVKIYDQAQDWYVRHAGLSDEHNEFPGNDVVKE